MATVVGISKADIRPSVREEGNANIALRKQVDERYNGLKVNRYSWWVHWRELADYIIPRRYKWLVTPNMMARGSPINQHMVDSTATIAARNLSSGLMSGLSSPTRPWFRLKIGMLDSTMTGPVSIWLAEVERRMFRVFARSNFYNAMAVLYFDLVVFGTAVMLIYEDSEKVIHCYNPCAGEFFVQNNHKFVIDSQYREFTLTVSETVQMFGWENTSPAIRQLYNTGGAALTRESIIGHAIEPNNDGRKLGIPAHFKYRECYWEIGQPREYVLRKGGFFEQPFVCPRWDLVSNDSYGRSPAMDALGDIKQLQQETKRKAQAIDKLVNPPLVADVQLKNQPASLLPGGITYIAGVNNIGMKPIYTVMPPVREIMEDLNEVRERIKAIFFNDLFQMISQFPPKSNVTATEIDARRSEQLVMLGPVLERIQNECLEMSVERVFAVMERAGLIPDPPAEVMGQNMQIEYVSMLSVAQAAAQTSGIERLFSITGNLAGLDPQIADVVDFDYALEKYSDLLENDPKLIRSPDQLQQIRQQRADEKQKQEEMQQSAAMVEGAKNLAATPVGGGRSALQSMTGLG